MASRAHNTALKTTVKIRLAAIFVAAVLGYLLITESSWASSLEVCLDSEERPDRRIRSCDYVIDDESLDVSNRADAYRERGLLHFQLGTPQEALRDLETAVELDPAKSVNLSALGRVYLAVGRIDDAEIVFERASSIEPDSINLGNYSDASGSMRVVRFLRSRYGDQIPEASFKAAANLLIAWDRSRARDYTGAVDAYVLARQQDSDLTYCLNDFAIDYNRIVLWDYALSHRRDAGEAADLLLTIEEFNDRLDAEPDNADLWRQRGLLFALVGAYGRALLDFQIAATTSKQPALDLVLVARTRLQPLRVMTDYASEMRLALAEIDRAIALGADDEVSHTTRGQILVQLNRDLEGLNVLQHAVAINEGGPFIRYLAAGDIAVALVGSGQANKIGEVSPNIGEAAREVLDFAGSLCPQTYR